MVFTTMEKVYLGVMTETSRDSGQQATLNRTIVWAGETFTEGTPVTPMTEPASGGYFTVRIEQGGRSWFVSLTGADVAQPKPTTSAYPVNHPYSVRKVTSGRTGLASYHVYKNGQRVSTESATREIAQQSADDLNIAAMVRGYDVDPRPYAVRSAEAAAAYKAQQASPGLCPGCGETFNGRRGLTAHQNSPFLTAACRPVQS